MNLDTLVSSSMLPWQPSRKAHDTEVWHRYNFPMAGTYKIDDDLVIFTVIGDTADRLSVWAYVPVTESDRAKVDSAEFDSPTEMREFIESMFAGREAAFALAKDLRVWIWTRHHVPPKDGLLPAATDALAEMVKDVIEQHEPPPPDVVFQAQLAQAEVATDELVDA